MNLKVNPSVICFKTLTCTTLLTAILKLGFTASSNCISIGRCYCHPAFEFLQFTVLTLQKFKAMFTPNKEKVYDNSFTTKPAQNTHASRKSGNSSSKRNSAQFVNEKNKTKQPPQN